MSRVPVYKSPDELPSKHYVYVIGPEIGPQKIGIAKNIRNRLSSYRTHNVQDVRIHFALCCLTEKAKLIEASAHRILRRHHDHGEWFKVTKEMAISAIQDARKLHQVPQVVTAAFHDGGKSNGNYHVYFYEGDYLVTDGMNLSGVGLPLIAIIKAHTPPPHKRNLVYELDFALEGCSHDPWSKRPTEYDREFRDINVCLNYAIDLIFERQSRT